MRGLAGSKGSGPASSPRGFTTDDEREPVSNSTTCCQFKLESNPVFCSGTLDLPPCFSTLIVNSGLLYDPQVYTI